MRQAREPSAITWEGDLVPPDVSYAASIRQTSAATRLYTPASTNRTNSAVVMRRPRRDGLAYFYAYGGTRQPVPGVPTPGGGGVRSSAWQQYLVQLHDWVVNTEWFAAGYPRNTGLTFRVSQLQTQVTGASGPGAMQQRPLFPAVQVVPRATVRARRYPTKGASS